MGEGQRLLDAVALALGGCRAVVGGAVRGLASQLLALAEKHRVTIPRLLIEAALNEDTENPSERRDQFMQLSALQRLIGSVANNINQIARHANSTGEVPPDAAASIAHAKAVIIRIDRQLADMAGR